MMRVLFTAVVVWCVGPLFVGSQGPPSFAPVTELNADETFNSATLTAVERKQILDQVEATSFDIPDSWDKELRVRRISLGQTDGLIVRGTQLLCGGTGNCQTWIFRWSSRQWLNMFARQAPIASKVAFEQRASSGVRNLLVSANISAAEATRILFVFDGKMYRQTECYDVANDGTDERVKTVPCR